VFPAAASAVRTTRAQISDGSAGSAAADAMLTLRVAFPSAAACSLNCWHRVIRVDHDRGHALLRRFGSRG